MVARSAAPRRLDWRAQLRAAVRDGARLCRLLDLDPALVANSGDAARQFPLLVPRGFLARMEPGNPADPLLRQILPQAAECRACRGFVADPLGERQTCLTPGLLQKYSGRALLLATDACAVHCRYCFRRHFPFVGSLAHTATRNRALAALAATPDLDEVILSGGDPLLLGERALATLFAALAKLPRLTRLRLHTRVPIVLPARIDEGFCRLLQCSSLAVVIVVQCNHAAELDADEVIAALARLRAAGATLLNQSVLLAGVNDSVDALRTLSERLFALGVLPYYLHRLDPVAGSAHFTVPARRARALIQALRRCLPGYLVPRPVLERAGADSKLPFA